MGWSGVESCMGFRARHTWVPTLALPLISCLTSDKLLNLPEAGFLCKHSDVPSSLGGWRKRP